MLRVKWIRDVTDNTAIPHYQMETDYKWRPYTSFPNHPPDNPHNSKGVPTFRLWLKMGAILEDGVSDQ